MLKYTQTMEMTTALQTEVDRNVGCGNIYGTSEAEELMKMPSSATLTEDRRLSRTTQIHSVDLNKHVAL